LGQALTITLTPGTSAVPCFNGHTLYFRQAALVSDINPAQPTAYATKKPLFADPALRWVDVEGELALITEEVVEGLLHPRLMGVVVPNEHTLRPEHRPPFAQIRCDGMIIMAAVDVDNINLNCMVSQNVGTNH
jgi:hypothetical protein